MLLAGQKVVVVGGSSGIGLSTAELAKSEGADVTIASRNA
jgi:NAD(P)-dependent dehydrogenase (short-subunit alcohol dehydrogenase family)